MVYFLLGTDVLVLIDWSRNRSQMRSRYHRFRNERADLFALAGRDDKATIGMSAVGDVENNLVDHCPSM